VPEQIVTHVLSLGVSGLLFVMWWFERQERMRNSTAVRDADAYAGRLTQVNEQVLDVLQANTEALVGLREELRTSRAFEREWRERLSRHLERLGETPQLRKAAP